MTRYGYFWKVLGTKFLIKVAQIPIYWLLGCFEKVTLEVKKGFGYILSNFLINWATFYSHIWSHCNSRASTKPLRLTNFDFVATLWNIAKILQKHFSRRRHGMILDPWLYLLKNWHNRECLLLEGKYHSTSWPLVWLLDSIYPKK